MGHGRGQDKRQGPGGPVTNESACDLLRRAIDRGDMTPEDRDLFKSLMAFFLAKEGDLRRRLAIRTQRETITRTAAR